MPRLIEGTTEEIVTVLQRGTFAGRRARIILEPDEEDFTGTFPDPPNSIRDSAHLEQLLIEGLASPTNKVTDETWEEVRREVRRRHVALNQ